MTTPLPPLRVRDLLSEDAIIADLRAGDRDAALAELAAAAARRDARCDGLLDKLLERERLGSTAIGGGVAIPHGKLPGLAGPLLVLALSRRGVDFAAPDGRPCRVFFLAVSSADAPVQNLSLLAAVSRIVRGSRGLLADLAAAGTAPEILDVVRRAEESLA